MRISFLFPHIDQTSEYHACRAWLAAFQDTPDMDCETSLSEDADVIFAFDAGTAQTLSAAHQSKCVLVWPQSLLTKAEDLISKGDSGLVAGGLSKLREIWVYPQIKLANQAIFRLSGCPKLRMVPHIWQPSFDSLYDAPARDDSQGIQVVILTDSVSDTASILQALLICDIANEQSPGKLKGITVVAESALKRAGALATAQALPRLSVQSCEVLDVWHYQQDAQYTVFLYWQTHSTENPEPLWDVAFGGFPLIHNLKTGLQAGVRVQEGDLMKAARFLVSPKSCFGYSYVESNRQALETLRTSAAQTIRSFSS